jgi:hypothetical protein
VHILAHHLWMGRWPILCADAGGALLSTAAARAAARVAVRPALVLEQEQLEQEQLCTHDMSKLFYASPRVD